jgi:proteasome beta subunit
MGTKTRRWRRSTFAGRFAAGHKGSLEKNAQGRSQPIQALSPAHGSVMERSPVAFDQNFSGLPNAALAQAGAASDFPELLRRKGLLAPAMEAVPPTVAAYQVVPGQQKTWQPTEATTILAFKFSGGVLVAGDRRATAGNTVVYDRADKVLEIDRHSIMAIAGVPATAWEMARVLEHSFQFFRRTQLQEMSVDGKVRALSKLLRDNFGFVMQGVGVVVPIFATYDGNSKPEARLYFYDAMGAQFEAADYAATGSGSPAVRGILYYENTWGPKALHKMNEDEAVSIALRALDTAAESDTSTGGVDRSGKIFPLIKTVSREGIKTLPEDRIAAVFKETVAAPR